MPEEQNQQQNTALIRNVAPTIIIGVGGTGKEVLLRLRRRFFERYNVFGFPTVSYLWIDTDTRNKDIQGQDYDHIMKQVMFGEEERVNAEVPAEAVAGYFNDARVSPHLFSWLDPRLAGLGRGIVDGAGQIRPLGRLAFFHKYTEIRNKLQQRLDNIRKQSALDEVRDKYGVNVDRDRLNIILVCSLAGGTGSGMFLDTAFLCLRMIPNADSTAYLLLPSVFASSIDNNQKIYANAYAALKELEYYSLRKDMYHRKASTESQTGQLEFVSRHDFIADWENKGRNFNINPPPIQGPPFKTCYLIDNATQVGGLIGAEDKAFLCDMIAENIFLNFSSEEFSRAKDSVRANLQQYLAKPLFYNYEAHGQQGGYIEVFAQCFSSFGFAKIYVPADRIRRACGYQLSLDILDRWLKNNETNPVDIDRALTKNELVKLSLRAGQGGDDFYTELSRVGQTTFTDEIQAAVSQWREEFLQEVKEKKPSLYTLIPQKLKLFLERTLDQTDRRPERWGEYLKTLDQNRRRFLTNTKGEFDPNEHRTSDGAILSRVKDWLIDDYVRLPLAVENLKVLSNILDRHVEQIFQPAQRTNEMTAQAAADDIKTKLEFVHDEEASFPVKRSSLQILVNQICELLQVHLTARMNAKIFGTAIEIINKELKPYIGKEEIFQDEQGNTKQNRAGLVLELWSLQEELLDIRQEMQERFESFESVREELIYENLYNKGMFREYYRIERPEGKYTVENKLEELEGRMLNYLSIANPHQLRNAVKDNRERVIRTIEEFCHKQFQELEVTADAIKIFKAKYSEEEQRERLKRFVANGSVRLPKNPSVDTYSQLKENRADTVLISQSKGNEERYREIYDLIKGSIHAADFKTPPQYPITKRADTVYLYTEYAGIPMAYVRNLEHYFRDAYLPLLRQRESLHIDYHDDKYTDLLIKHGNDIDLLTKASRALLVGAILRVIQVKDNGEGDVTFSFERNNSGIPEIVPLFGRMTALETLKRNAELLHDINMEIATRRHALRTEASKRFFTVVAYHLIDENPTEGFSRGPFAKSYIKAGEELLPFYPPERKALEEIRDEVFGELETQLGSSENVSEALRYLYKKLDSFSEVIMIEGLPIRLLRDGFENLT